MREHLEGQIGTPHSTMPGGKSSVVLMPSRSEVEAFTQIPRGCYDCKKELEKTGVFLISLLLSQFESMPFMVVSFTVLQSIGNLYSNTPMLRIQSGMAQLMFAVGPLGSVTMFQSRAPSYGC